MLPWWIIPLLGAAALCPAACLLLTAHRNALMNAQLAKDWEARARWYDEADTKLNQDREELLGDMHPLPRFSFWFVSQHYQASAQNAWGWAHRYRARLPLGLRDWYLRRAA